MHYKQNKTDDHHHFDVFNFKLLSILLQFLVQPQLVFLLFIRLLADDAVTAVVFYCCVFYLRNQSLAFHFMNFTDLKQVEVEEGLLKEGGRSEWTLFRFESFN